MMENLFIFQFLPHMAIMHKIRSLVKVTPRNNNDKQMIYRKKKHEMKYSSKFSRTKSSGLPMAVRTADKVNKLGVIDNKTR